jgi:hypothetical protein
MAGAFRQTICMKAGWITFIGMPNWTLESFPSMRADAAFVPGVGS